MLNKTPSGIVNNPQLQTAQVSVKWNWRQRKKSKKMFTICCPRRVKMFFTKRQSLVALKAVAFVFVFSLYFLVLIKESMNVMESNAKSKTVTASKVDNVSISHRCCYHHRPHKTISNETQFCYCWKRRKRKKILRAVVKIFSCFPLKPKSSLLFLSPSLSLKHTFMFRICFA